MQSLNRPNLHMENTGALVVLRTVGVISRIYTCIDVFQRSLKYKLVSTYAGAREVPPIRSIFFLSHLYFE